MVKAAKRLESLKEYYFSTKLKEIELLNSMGEQVINLGIGNPDLSPSEETVNELINYSRKSDTHRYQKYNGTEKLRNSFSEWYHKYYKVSLDPESEILPLLGSKEGIFHISMAFLDTGDKVLVPDPGYPAYSSISGMLGAQLITYDLVEKNSWYPDLEKLNRSDLNAVKLMWVNYPNMPTGAKATKSLFKDLIDFGKQNNILICNDNPYSFILNKEPLSILSVDGAKDTALELNSLSKSHNMAGWRIGVVSGKKEYIENIIRVKSNIDSGMFLPIQLAAARALKNPDSWYDLINNKYSKRRKLVWDILDSLGTSFSRKQGGMFVWARISDNYRDAESFSDNLLLKSRIFITPGSVFGKNGNKHIRISLCTNEEKLLEAKERIIKM